MSAHALLSPSGAHRWMRCPGSALAEAAAADVPSPYAEEGRLAHEFAELCLRHGLDAVDLPADDDLPADAGPSWARYPDEMREPVQQYLDLVRAAAVDGHLETEQRLVMSEWVEGGFGTADALILRDGEIELIDLKFGRGVRVEAAGNEQLMLYALGVLQTWGPLFRLEAFVLTICQPRLDHTSSWRVSVEELTAFGERVRAAATAALRPDAARAPGDHCRFCRVRATCRARAEANLATAANDFRPLADLSLAELAAILPRLDEIEAWAKDAREYVRTQAEQGEAVPGFKLVAGRSLRRWRDEAAAAKALRAAGARQAEIYTRTLIGIPAAEKLLGGPKKAAPALSGLIDKPEGKPTLVPDTDPRPALNPAASAAADFAPAA